MSDPTTPGRRSRWFYLRAAFGLAGLFFIVVALIRTIRDSKESVIPSWPYVVIAAVLAMMSLIIGSRAWTSLFDDGDGADLRRGFYASQLGKYIPGGIWQMVALVGSASRTGAGVARSSVRFPVYALTLIAAGGTVGAGLAVSGGGAVPASTRWLSLLGLVTIPLLSRRYMLLAVRLFRRVTRRELSDDALPTQVAIVRSYVFGIVGVGVGSAAFAVILGSFHTGVSTAEAITAFSLAWTVGFVAVPFPAGVGIREAVLIGVLSTGLQTPVVSAAVAQRIVLMIAELLIFLFTSPRTRARIA